MAHESETIVVIGAAMLAVLPLRSVIVPSEIPILTRIDFELGLWLALIVAFGVLHLAVRKAVPATSTGDSDSNANGHSSKTTAPVRPEDTYPHSGDAD